MNQFTIYVVTALVILTLVLAIIGGYWYAEAQEIKDELNQRSTHFYVSPSTDSLIEGIFTFIRYFQLLSLLLPTSLFVTIEILKAAIAYII